MPFTFNVYFTDNWQWNKTKQMKYSGHRMQWNTFVLYKFTNNIDPPLYYHVWHEYQPVEEEKLTLLK